MKRELSVGVVFLLAVLALSFMLSRLTIERKLGGETRTFFTIVNDSTGLPEGTAVKVAGITVGTLREKTLNKNRAKLKLEIASTVSICRDAHIKLRNIGYLGDRYLDLILCEVGESMVSEPLLREGSVIFAEEGLTVENLLSKGADVLDSWAEAGRRLSKLIGGS